MATEAKADSESETFACQAKATTKDRWKTSSSRLQLGMYSTNQLVLFNVSTNYRTFIERLKYTCMFNRRVTLQK